MNRIALGLSLSDLSTPFRRCSKSPRYLVPASSAPMSSEYTLDSARISGTSFCDDAPGQAFGDGGLAHAGLADQQRVVLAAAAQDLDHALDLVLAADQRIDLAVLGGLVQVLRELLQRRSLLVLLAALFAFARGPDLAALGGLRADRSS